MFPRGESNNLFLTEQGKVLKSRQYRKSFKAIVRSAVLAGIPLPLDLSTHDLRRTYATNALTSNPLAYRKVLKHLGHSYPSSAAPYLISTDDDVDESQNDLLDIFVDPHVKKRGK
jgi:integrase